MQLLEQNPDTAFYIKSCFSDHIVLPDRTLYKSFLVTPQQVIEDWPVASFAAIDNSHLHTLLALKPKLVILGTGQQQVFPSTHLLATFLTRHIGVEIMHNTAAASTFNILAEEGRQVVAGFIVNSVTGAL